jgi:hypothetical protein
MKSSKLLLFLARRLSLLLCPLLLHGLIVTAQMDCGVVDEIALPVDAAQFRVAQEYGSASSRHLGRFHSGDDWYGGRGSSLGQPVMAAARGRVTYSYELGWGRDGGVVIIEHTLADGTIFYSQYGHLMATDLYPLPTRLSCVERGAVIGAIADVRPAPHLHFEIRVNNGSDPGAGYTRNDPYLEGYRNPAKFIINLQARLRNWHAWQLMVGSESSADERGPLSDPVVLNDNSLLFLDGDGNTLRRATADGRVLWRNRLDAPAVAVIADRGRSLLVLQDGTFVQIDVETGAGGESWRVDGAFAAAPLRVADRLLFPAQNGGLLLVDPVQREIVKRYDDLAAFSRLLALPDGSLAGMTADHQLVRIDAAGTLLDRTHLREQASLALFADRLLVYSAGGLWQVDTGGSWSLWDENAPAGGADSALLVTVDRVYAFSGARLIAYDHTRQIVWETAVPATSGTAQITLLDGLLLVSSVRGDLLLVTGDGRVCNQARVYGRQYAQQWSALGSDGLLRVAIADQIFALRWDLFTNPCRI